jgi:hypothetical protein
MFEKNNIIGSEYWVNSANKPFPEIINDNFQLPKKWGSSEISFNENYINKILKPINGYANIFSTKPELIDNNGEISLRYYTHAEIWVEPKDNGVYALDKCWQTQFYPSEIEFDIPDDCYDAGYKFYTPWLLDVSKNFYLKEIKESPFKILKNDISFNLLKKQYLLDSPWIYFAIKKTGKHISYYENEPYSILDIKTPICDTIIDDKNILERLLNDR